MSFYEDSEKIAAENRAKSCCFTGHRDIPTAHREQLNTLLEKRIEQAIADGYSIFCAGGAVGFDTMSRQAVLKLKKRYPHISLHLYLPYPSQADKWSRRQKRLYEKIKSESDKITFAGIYAHQNLMRKRNMALADNSSLCIAYCTKTSGGTVFTVSYAMDKGLKVENLAHCIKEN